MLFSNAVCTTRGMKLGEDISAFLLELNLSLPDKEIKAELIAPAVLPGGPSSQKNLTKIVNALKPG